MGVERGAYVCVCALKVIFSTMSGTFKHCFLTVILLSGLSQWYQQDKYYDNEMSPFLFSSGDSNHSIMSFVTSIFFLSQRLRLPVWPSSCLDWPLCCYMVTRCNKSPKTLSHSSQGESVIILVPTLFEIFLRNSKYASRKKIIQYWIPPPEYGGTNTVITIWKIRIFLRSSYLFLFPSLIYFGLLCSTAILLISIFFRAVLI